MSKTQRGRLGIDRGARGHRPCTIPARDGVAIDEQAGEREHVEDVALAPSRLTGEADHRGGQRVSL